MAVEKATLIQLTAEVRWERHSLREGYHERFAAFAAQEGIRRYSAATDRDVNVGPHHSIVEFRPADPTESSPLYRLGGGSFSVTALSPHKSWAEVEPKVRAAMRIVERTFVAGGDAPRLSGASMRYVDGFAASADGEPTLKHFAEALGCCVELRAGLRDVCIHPLKIAPRICLIIPVAPGEMTVVLEETTIGNDKTIIMDKTVIIDRDIPPNAASAMDLLIEARGPIHDLFTDLMQNLGDLKSRQ